ncbi:MAG: SEC-C metal-binding domain-containing protein [Bacteroidetes bacterium]|nr:SEC-C metal-binding domain-containing protein [Bacteroidota bacterium]
MSDKNLNDNQDVVESRFKRPAVRYGLPRRNDQCPCGSGEKYKKCCLEFPVKGKVLAWKRISKIYQQIPPV